ncbi:MAG TPA: DUF1810 domain-containing protein [Magnetospirillaceae bacterium]|nr:DUF1810 domain-containing protein [Magnetospirillaceae bacterium]
MGDPDSLDRFVTAQAPVIGEVRAELKAGRKTSHWMWFIFPQLRGLGQSAMSRHYGIADIAEARAYLAHPLLGPCLRDCTTLAISHVASTAYEIFGSPDDLKFRSSMTLFHLADPDEPLFRHALDQFYAGSLDHFTVSQSEN